MTSANGRELDIQNDNTPISADSGFYIEFILYFAGTGPMKVYLTEDESEAGLDDGTAVKVGDPTIKNTGWEYVINSVRISFEPFDDSHGNGHIAGEPDAKIYEPNKNDTTTLAYPSGLGGGTQNTLSSPPVINTGRDPEAALFELTTANNWRAAVRVRIWIEGNDPDCVNLDTKSIEESQFLTQLRFEGVDTP
jgi:hypothetical protein